MAKTPAEKACHSEEMTEEAQSGGGLKAFLFGGRWGGGGFCSEEGAGAGTYSFRNLARDVIGGHNNNGDDGDDNACHLSPQEDGWIEQEGETKHPMVQLQAAFGTIPNAACKCFGNSGGSLSLSLSLSPL